MHRSIGHYLCKMWVISSKLFFKKEWEHWSILIQPDKQVGGSGKWDKLYLDRFIKLLNELCSLGGFYHSKIISAKRITHFVPFLPLCRRHVERCAQRDLCQRGECQRKDVSAAVGGAMSYTPQDGQHFSSTGCKLVPAKVNLFLWAMGVIGVDIAGTSDQLVFICASAQEQILLL